MRSHENRRAVPGPRSLCVVIRSAARGITPCGLVRSATAKGMSHRAPVAYFWGTHLVDDARRYDGFSAGARYLSIVERGGLQRGSSQLADPAERPAGFHFLCASL